MGGKVLQLESERLKEEGMKKGIEALVLDNLEEGTAKERILDKLQLYFSLDRKKAEDYYIRFSLPENKREGW